MYPTIMTDLRFFLGLCTGYRRFMPNFDRKAAPLNRLLKNRAMTKIDLKENEPTVIDEVRQNFN